MSFILTKLLIKLFVKEPDNTNNETTRNQYGLLGGFVGIISNLLLFTAKLIIGLLSSSISILADAFNNLSDWIWTSRINIRTYNIFYGNDVWI